MAHAFRWNLPLFSHVRAGCRMASGRMKPIRRSQPMSSKVSSLTKTSLKQRVSSEEWDARVNLAACYRLAAHFRMTDMIYTHISARVPGPEHHFLINAFGQLWDEIGASTLVKVTLDGEIVDDPVGNGINRACYVI